MSIRDGLEPSRSQDSDTHTQPIPRDEAAPDHPAGASPGPRLQPDEAPAPGPGQSDHPTTPADQAWPPSWGQSPSSWEQAPAPADSPAWTQPTAAQGPSWTRQAGNDAADAPGTGPAAPDADGPPPPPRPGRQPDLDPAHGRPGPLLDPAGRERRRRRPGNRADRPGPGRPARRARRRPLLGSGRWRRLPDHPRLGRATGRRRLARRPPAVPLAGRRRGRGRPARRRLRHQRGDRP
jgi:hypothetical protein